MRSRDQHVHVNLYRRVWYRRLQCRTGRSTGRTKYLGVNKTTKRRPNEGAARQSTVKGEGQPGSFSSRQILSAIDQCRNKTSCYSDGSDKTAPPPLRRSIRCIYQLARRCTKSNAWFLGPARVESARTRRLDQFSRFCRTRGVTSTQTTLLRLQQQTASLLRAMRPNSAQPQYMARKAAMNRFG